MQDEPSGTRALLDRVRASFGLSEALRSGHAGAAEIESFHRDVVELGNLLPTLPESSEALVDVLGVYVSSVAELVRVLRVVKDMQESPPLRMVPEMAPRAAATRSPGKKDRRAMRPPMFDPPE